MNGDNNRLKGCRVLVLEDEFLLASDLELALKRGGADVIGPFGDLSKATEEAARSTFDVAILDINLRDGATYPIADELMRRGIPFVFGTGYSAEVIPHRFQGVPRWEKPYNMQQLVEDVARLCRLVTTAD